MDPFSALSLASNVVQFVDFGSKLVSRILEIHHSADGALAANVDLETIITDLRNISESLGPPGGPNTPENGTSLVQLTDSCDAPGGLNALKNKTSLEQLADSCNALANELLSVLEGLKVEGRRKKWGSVRKALKSAWKEGEVKALSARLDMFRSQLTNRLVALLRYSPLQISVK